MNRQHTGPRAGFTRTELVIVLAIIAGLFALLYPAVQNARNAKGPHGETYPSTAPNEASRVTHPTGISIVLPVNWDNLSSTDPISTTLRIAARGTPGRRLKSVIAISQCHPEPDQQTLDRCTKLRFQDSPAYEICRVERNDSFDDPARSSYDLYIQRQDGWWCVNYLVADEINVLPNSIRQYIETIAFPAPKNPQQTKG